MTIYEIRVQGHLHQRWSAWFEGLAITYDTDDNTVLRGPLVDEAALHGVLIKVRDLALPLLAVNRVGRCLLHLSVTDESSAATFIRRVPLSPCP
jgi:hypothetical protein